MLTHCEEQETLQFHIQDLRAGFNMIGMGGNQVFSSREIKETALRAVDDGAAEGGGEQGGFSRMPSTRSAG